MFKVYHTKNWSLNALLHFDTDGYVPYKEDYKPVALVDCDRLEDTFELTNHIDHSWTENVEVTVLSEKCRSTSVGDVVEDSNTGHLFICASVGWEKTSWSQLLKSNDKWWKKNADRLAEYTAAMKRS